MRKLLSVQDLGCHLNSDRIQVYRTVAYIKIGLEVREIISEVSRNSTIVRRYPEDIRIEQLQADIKAAEIKPREFGR